MVLAQGVSSGSKRLIGRMRPDSSDRMSLPSGHATLAMYAAITTVQNLSDSRLSKPLQVTGSIIGISLATACAWSRVESGVHYPTDVLAGLALGNAASVFVYELYRTQKNPAQLSVTPTGDGLGLTLKIPVR